MNLIEQLGGYERTANLIKSVPEGANFLEMYPLGPRFYVSDIGCNRAINIHLLSKELLEYRRQHNIFEVGDKVTLSKWANDFSRSHNGIYEILSFENDLETLALLSQDIRSSTQHIKHATDEEIAAGHRL